jgi:3-hydroxybutyryl-CoA dehydrogenase
MPSNLRHAEEALRQSLGPSAMPLVSFASTVEGAVREADLAIDCVPDELESKLEIFSLMDRMAPPKTVFATPTVNLSITDLASCTYRPSQCVALALNANELTQASDQPASGSTTIPIRITSLTSVQAQDLVGEFWLCLGCTPVIELEVLTP